MKAVRRIATACLFLVASAAWAQSESVASSLTAKGWLERMSNAVEYLNYEGTLVYMSPGHAETFNVFHRVDNREVIERLIAMDGAGAEIIRNSQELICIFPSTETVVVESRGSLSRKPNPLQASLPAYTDALDAHYRSELLGEDRVLDRLVAVVAIIPLDEYRYGYRLWLDMQTAIPLKAQLTGSSPDMPVEEIRFTELRLPEMVSLAAVQTDLDTSGYTWTRQKDSAADQSVDSELGTWMARDLPAGFMQTIETLEIIQSSNQPRKHLVFSDGLASVSVFVDMGVAAAEQVEGLAMIGAANAYSVMRDGLLVTAMGEVPPRTVERIALSMQSVDDK